MKLISSIVTYKPDLQRLKQNVAAIDPQVDEIVVVDNGSKNVADVIGSLSGYNNIHFIKNKDNMGIATALNEAAQYAKEQGYEWIITLDQDSVAPSNLVETYLPYTKDKSIGMLCCKIIDRNFGELDINKRHNHGCEEVPMCITSASMMNIKAWDEVGGFPEDFFIDSVDFDICLSMREHGYKIVRTNDTALLHEVGHSEIRHSFGKDRQIYHHNPIRYYYMVRNGIFLGKRHHFVIKATYRVFRMAFFTLLYDDRRIQKARMMLKGLYHAIINRYGEYK